MGALTGQGFGLCRTYRQAAGSRGPGMRSFGMGFGRGAGHRQRRRWSSDPVSAGFFPYGDRLSVYGDPDPAFEKQILQREVSSLQAHLKVIQERLAAMEDAAGSQ